MRMKPIIYIDHESPHLYRGLIGLVNKRILPIIRWNDERNDLLPYLINGENILRILVETNEMTSNTGLHNVRVYPISYNDCYYFTSGKIVKAIEFPPPFMPTVIDFEKYAKKLGYYTYIGWFVSRNKLRRLWIIEKTPGYDEHYDFVAVINEALFEKLEPVQGHLHYTTIPYEKAKLGELNEIKTENLTIRYKDEVEVFRYHIGEQKPLKIYNHKVISYTPFYSLFIPRSYIDNESGVIQVILPVYSQSKEPFILYFDSADHIPTQLEVKSNHLVILYHPRPSLETEAD